MERCKERVRTKGLFHHYHQCHRKAVADGFCKQHHPDAKKARDEIRDRKYEEKLAASPWVRLQTAQETILELSTALRAALPFLEGKVKQQAERALNKE